MLNMSCMTFMFLLIFAFPIEAFNLAPYPSLVINSPKNLKFQMKQTRSSYFGYTLVIRPTSIIVGAPRAQSTLESQQDINETGAIYRCSLDNGYCRPYIVDKFGNLGPREGFSSGYKDFQWLGGSMDGGTRDTDLLLVCAPRFYVSSISIPDHDLMTGVCYRVRNTVGQSPRYVTPIYQIGNNLDWWDYKRETGFSAHVVDDNAKFLLGAPGYGMGTMFAYRTDDFKPEDSVVEIEGDAPRDADIFYFGYALSSGYFDSDNTSGLLYAVTAPQADQQSGETYIVSPAGKILQKLRGDQLGEYFGYSVLAEDLNGDQLTDLVVSAPMYGMEDSHDDGAIYVFINKGHLNFEKRILRSPVASNGRFGTTLSRLGDINHDGFKDIAVGAPFAGNGSVFVYLGSKQGLRDEPSQQLDSPSQLLSKYGTHMFGHGLSRGSDIDGNGFNDLAIGAPNAEAVLLYRAYPVVKLYGTVRADKRVIAPEQERLNITACYRLSTTAKEKEVQEQILAIRIVADSQLKRVTSVLTQTNEINYRADVGLSEKCRVLEVQVSFNPKYVYKPIDVWMHYGIVQIDAGQEKFCESCVAVDPTDANSFTERIVFDAGCASEVCVADLQLKSPDMGSTFTLGSSNILRVTYEITNAGETAYLPEFNVTSDYRLTFAHVPGNCEVIEAVMMCNLKVGQALAKGESDSVTVSFDVSQLNGTSLMVTAEVFSAGYEKNSKDNKHINVISLREFTEIDVTGKQANAQITFETYGKSSEIMNHYEIKSHGPSAIEQLSVSLQIPIAYKNIESSKPIINITSLKLLATYDSQPLVIELFDQDNNLLSQEAGKTLIEKEETDLEDRNSGTNDTYALLSEDFKGQLPVNRTIVFSCRDTNTTMCIRASMQLDNFMPSKSIHLNVSYHVDLGEVNSILVNPWKYFVILTDLELVKNSDPTSGSIAIKRRIEPNIISKHLKAILPIWIMVPSIVAGLLILSVMSYAMYKFGFFHRAKKEEMNRLIQ